MRRLIIPILFATFLAAAPAFSQTPAPSPETAERTVRLHTAELPQAPSARRLALCIGIDGYQCNRYAALKYAVADAKAMAQTLAKLGYETWLMTDDAEDQSHADHWPMNKPRPVGPATYANLDQRLFEFMRLSRHPDDTLIVFFAGHGDKDADQAVLLPLDYGQRERPLTLGSVLDTLGSARCQARKKMLILDACRSAAENPQRRLSSGFLQALGAPTSFLILSACGVNQYSVEDASLGHGRFTATLLDGLNGKAFADGQEFLLATQLSEYVHAEFRERKWASAQSPKTLGEVTADVRFDVCRRDLPTPPRLSRHDQRLVAMSLKDADEAWIAANYTDAVDAATTAWRIQPNNADALAIRALAYQSLAYLDAAEKDIAAALKFDAHHAVALQARAGVAIKRENPNASKDDLEQVEKLLAERPDAWPLLKTPRLVTARLAARGYFEAIAGRFESAIACCTTVIETKDVPPNVTAVARLVRGVCYREIAQHEKAVADFTHIIKMADAPADGVIMALVGRASCYDELGQYQNAIADGTRVIETPNVSTDRLARALVTRGFCTGKCGHPDQELADYARLFAMKDAPAEQTAQALVNRAIHYASLGQFDKAMADCAQVIDMPNVPPEQLAWAMVNRSACYERLGQLDKAIVQCTLAIQIKDVPLKPLATALANRGLYYGKTGRFKEANADCTRVIDMKGAPIDALIQVLAVRGFCDEKLGQWEQGVRDCTRFIELKGATGEMAAWAFYGRGSFHEYLGHYDQEIADCTQILQMQNASAAVKAAALANRGAAYMHQGQAQKAIADCTRALEHNDLPDNVAAKALTVRARARYRMEDLDGALTDSRDALLRDNSNRDAGYTGALVLLRQGKPDSAQLVYRRMLPLGVPPAALDDLIELRDKLHGPPECNVFLGWLKLQAGKSAGRSDIQAYLRDHPDGALAAWAKEILATPPASQPKS